MFPSLFGHQVSEGTCTIQMDSRKPGNEFKEEAKWIRRSIEIGLRKHSDASEEEFK